MNNDLFNNPFVEAAKKALSDKDKERYARLGECMYDGMNFETLSDEQTLQTPSFMSDAVFQIQHMIRSGLHPSLLDDNEKNVMKEVEGDLWYEKYGFEEVDLTDIVNVYSSGKLKI